MAAVKHEEFIGQTIRPVEGTFDVSRVGAGEPALPREFVWGKKRLKIVQVLRTWKETGPCTHKSGERYVAKHWYEVVASTGETLQLYFERKPRLGASRRYWRLFSIGAPKVFALFLLTSFLTVSAWALGTAPSRDAKGTLAGVVASKGSKWVEIIPDAGGPIQRFIPPGGLPEDGKDYDKGVLAQLAKVRGGERVELEWELVRYPRVVKIKSLGRPGH